MLSAIYWCRMFSDDRGGCDMVVVIWWCRYGGVDMPLILQLFKTH